MEIAVRAIESQYRGSPPTTATVDQFDGPLGELLDGLHPDTATRLSTALSDLSAVSPADACWAARLLYGRVLTSPEPERRILIRGLVQQ